MDFNTCYLVHSPDPSKVIPHDSLTDTSNIVYCSITSVFGTPMNDLSPLWSRSHSTTHLDRVVTTDCHDMDAWTQEQKVQDSELNTVAVSSSLEPNGAVPENFFPINVVKSSFALMELQTAWPQTVEQSSGRLCKDTAIPPCDWTPLVPVPGSDISPVRPHVAIGPCSHEDLAKGRRRVGEILVNCGVIDVSAAVGCGSHDFDGRPDDVPITTETSELRFVDKNEFSITALADWTSEWVHTLVIQPYLRGSYRFQFQGKSSRASTSVAQRIHRVLNNVENPMQVAIHALWLIGALAQNATHDNAPFLSVPIFRYLHNNGTFVAEDFMFRTFIPCAMIGDKTINDATLSTSTWNRLTRIPQVILNATEKYALSCLKWNVVMTPIQWQDTITYLRSCIKMSSAVDHFSYEGSSPSGVMACYLDELINLSHANQQIYKPQQELFAVETLTRQSVRHSTLSVLSTAEWCPEHDPVINQKPRIIGIAPGADQDSSALKVGTTAKELLDTILGSSGVPSLGHPAQPAGTSFCELQVHATMLLGCLLMASMWGMYFFLSPPLANMGFILSGIWEKASGGWFTARLWSDDQVPAWRQSLQPAL